MFQSTLASPGTSDPRGQDSIPTGWAPLKSIASGPGYYCDVDSFNITGGFYALNVNSSEYVLSFARIGHRTQKDIFLTFILLF